jgi:exodeoxyribonuclease VII large subunit
LTQVYTVTELNGRIRDRLSTDPRLHDLWARGEISNVVNHRSGHRYFTLKDKDTQISCVLFRGDGCRLKFQLKDGLNVLVYGGVEVYGPRGQVQVVARGIKLDSGLGFRKLEFEALKKKLSAEGLLDEERKRPLPRCPSRIGIVTSLDGAAIRDVLKILGSFPAKMILSPAQVQGDGSEESIAFAIKALQGRADLVIVCRGGGSVEDLWSFNAEIVARAIAECDAPVISAVGHETDVTIADFVADVRVPTPTAAAQMAIPSISDLQDCLKGTETRMTNALWSRIKREEDRLYYLSRGLSAKKAYTLVTDARQRLDYLEARLIKTEVDRALHFRNRLTLAEGRLRAVSPLAVLTRGYAIVVSSDGKRILKAGDAGQENDLELLFSDGRVRCRVLERGEDEGDLVEGKGRGSKGGEENR